jgi:hypothetical protein
LLKLIAAGAAASMTPVLINGLAQQPIDQAPLIWRGSARNRYVALTYDDCYLVKRLQDLEVLLAGFPEFSITLFPVGMALLNNEGTRSATIPGTIRTSG